MLYMYWFDHYVQRYLNIDQIDVRMYIRITMSMCLSFLPSVYMSRKHNYPLTNEPRLVIHYTIAEIDRRKIKEDDNPGPKYVKEDI